MANTRILNAAVVAALFAACTDVPCETKGAVRDHRDVCGCPDGTREVERVVNDDSKSECVSGDAGGVTIDNASETDASRVRPVAADGGREMDSSLLVDAAKEAGKETGASVLTVADDAGDVLTLADAGSPEMPVVPACIPAAEDCNGKDDDCDGKVDNGVKTRCWADADGDGYAATGAALVESCDACGAKQTAQEPVAGKVDCDDGDAKKSPGATDICGDKVDNDCDGKPDDDDNNVCGGACSVQLPGKPGDVCNNGQQGACARPGTYECRPDHSMVCNAPMVPAAAAEVCGNGKDDDCKNGVDDGCVKNLCGGWSPLTPPVGGSCMVMKGTCSYLGKYACAPGSTDATACGGEPPPESCSTAADDNCNGTANEGCCVPTTEVCDGKDNDCDGMVDEGFVTGGSCTAGKGECLATGTLQCDRGAVACTAVEKAPPTWYRDCDGDGYALPTGSMSACSAPTAGGCAKWLTTVPTAASTDCDDANPQRYPGAKPVVNATTIEGDSKTFTGDTNCNGVVEKSPSFDWSIRGEPNLQGRGVSYRLCWKGGEPCEGGLDTPCVQFDGAAPGGSDELADDGGLPCGYSWVSIITKTPCTSVSAVARRLCE
jgi:hypothetical protein